MLISDKNRLYFISLLFFFQSSPKDILTEREREGGREKNINVREKHPSVAFCKCLDCKTEPATQIFALTGNQNCNISVYEMTLKPTELHQTGPEKIDFNTKAITKDREGPNNSSSGYLSKETKNTNSKTYTSLCSWQHYLQQPRYGSNLSAHQQTNG